MHTSAILRNKLVYSKQLPRFYLQTNLPNRLSKFQASSLLTKNSQESDHQLQLQSRWFNHSCRNTIENLISLKNLSYTYSNIVPVQARFFSPRQGPIYDNNKQDQDSVQDDEETSEFLAKDQIVDENHDNDFQKQLQTPQSIQQDENYCATVAMSQDIYDDLELQKIAGKFLEKVKQIQNYKFLKQQKLQQKKIALLNEDEFQQAVNKAFEEILSSFADLNKNQIGNETKIETQQIFTNELNISVKKAQMYYYNGTFENAFTELVGYSIYVDAKNQMIMIESTCSGVHAFEFNNLYKVWNDTFHLQYFIQQFLQEDLQPFTSGNFSFK